MSLSISSSSARLAATHSLRLLQLLQGQGGAHGLARTVRDPLMLLLLLLLLLLLPLLLLPLLLLLFLLLLLLLLLLLGYLRLFPVSMHE